VGARRQRFHFAATHRIVFQVSYSKKEDDAGSG
jgi:hypothetical protein